MLIQAILLLLAFASIPFLLLGKPLVLRSRMKAHAHDDSFSSQSQLIAGEHKSSGNEKGDAAEGGHGGHDDHDFSEIVIHQVKACVGFCLFALV